MFLMLQMVKPKQKRVQEAQEALKLAQNSLSQKQASLKKVLVQCEKHTFTFKALVYLKYSVALR